MSEQNQNDEYSKCSYCNNKAQDFLRLKCEHLLCQQCLKRQLILSKQNKSNEGKDNKIKMQQNNVLNETKMNLKCKVCQKVSVFNDDNEKSQYFNESQSSDRINQFSHGSKENKNSTQKQDQSFQQNSQQKKQRSVINFSKIENQMLRKQIFCISCQDKLLNLQEFLVSEHRSHKVSSLQDYFPTIEQTLISFSKQFQQLKESLHLYSARMIESKKTINKEYQEGMHKIKSIFEEIKKQLLIKEQETIKQFQFNVMKKYKIIQALNQITEKQKNQAKIYKQQVQEILQSNKNLNMLKYGKNNNKNFVSMVKSTQFYLENRKKFQTFVININQILNQEQENQKQQKNILNWQVNQKQQKNMLKQIKNLSIISIFEKYENYDMANARKQAKCEQEQSQKQMKKQNQYAFFKKKKQQIFQFCQKTNRIQVQKDSLINKNQQFQKYFKNITASELCTKAQYIVKKKHKQHEFQVNKYDDILKTLKISDSVSKLNIDKSKKQRRMTEFQNIDEEQTQIQRKISQLKGSIKNNHSRISSYSFLPKKWVYD